MKFDQITTGLAQAEDVDKILEINKLEYGISDILATPADFDWRYNQNPTGRAIIPVIRNDCHKVAGFICVVPLRLRLKGQDRVVATGTNLVIQPEYRNTFAYIKLIRRFEQVFSDSNIPLHFSFVSETTYRQLRKHSPQTAWTVPLLIKPLNFVSLAEAYFSQGWQRFVIGQTGRLVSPFLFRRQQPASTEQITVQAIDGFDASFNTFWQQVQDKYPVMTIRNQAFLAWRFARVSGRFYRILVAQTQGQMLGYIVLRCSIIHGVKTGLIMDLLVTNGALGKAAGACLLLEAETYFRAQEMSLLVGLMEPPSVEYHLLRRAGYARCPEALSPRPFRFAFFFHHTTEENLISLSAQDWFITLADYESF